MKTLSIAVIIAAATISISSCSAGRMARTGSDDVYYSGREERMNDYPVQTQQTSPASRPDDYSSQPAQNTYQGAGQPAFERDNQNNQFSDNQNSQGGYNNTDGQDQGRSSYSQNGDGNSYVTNNYYYDEEDYYDYAYSARVRRFYHPYGWSYYDPFYTNMYWYDSNPFSWGVSLYCTYNWWNPRPVVGWGWGGGFGMGYGFGPGNYNPYWNGGWGWNNGWGWNGGYWNGYNQGYWNGYYAGLYNGTFNPYYFNSFDNHSYYYGPRGGRNSVAANTPGYRGGRTGSVGELYGRTLYSEEKRSLNNTGASDGDYALGRPKRDIKSLDSQLVPAGRDGRNAGAAETAQPRGGGKGNSSTAVEPGRGNSTIPGSNNNPRTNTGETYTPRDNSGNGKGNPAPGEIRNPRSNTNPSPSSGPANQTPRSNDTYQPRSNDVNAPRGNDNYTPRNNDNSNPRGNDGYTPRGNENNNPRNNDSYSPRGTDYSTPRGNQNTTPGGNGSTPRGNTNESYSPRGNQGTPTGGSNTMTPSNSSPSRNGDGISTGSGRPRVSEGTEPASNESRPSKSGVRSNGDRGSESKQSGRPSRSSYSSPGNKNSGAGNEMRSSSPSRSSGASPSSGGRSSTPSGGSSPRRGR